jgi:hypothetical protein
VLSIVFPLAEARPRSGKVRIRVLTQ